MEGGLEGELLELARWVVSRAADKEEVEAFALRRVETEVEALGGEVDSLTSAESRGLGVRVVKEGRQGYASTAVVTEEGLQEVLAEARSNAEVATPDEANGLPDPEDPADVGQLVHPEFSEATIEDKIALAIEIEAAALADPRVRGVDVAKYSDAYVEIALVSSRGLERMTARSDAWAFVFPMASANGETQTGLGVTLGRAASELDVEGAGREAAERATRLLGARKPESRHLPVVFDPYATASFLGVLARALSAEAVLKGRSLFAGRLGEKVSADGVTLVDDGVLPGGPDTAPWDGEGVARRTTPLIESGVLRSFLHNTWTARRYGGDARSTGNASRGSFRSSPGVSPTNLFLEPGELGADEILRRAGEALYVQDVVGLHSGANPISGDFSVGVTGLMVRDGQFAEPVREATVASTIVEVLRSILAVGADLRFYPFGGALGGSTVLIEDMAVAGR